jgi:hypothetical protein
MQRHGLVQEDLTPVSTWANETMRERGNNGLMGRYGSNRNQGGIARDSALLWCEKCLESRAL